jgi:hypothetical protein
MSQLIIGIAPIRHHPASGILTTGGRILHLLSTESSIELCAVEKVQVVLRKPISESATHSGFHPHDDRLSDRYFEGMALS